MSSPIQLLVPIHELLPTDIQWPEHLQPADGSLEDLLSKIYFTDYSASAFSQGIGFSVTICILSEISLPIPGLDGVTLVLGGSAGPGMTSFGLSTTISASGFSLRFEDLQVALRFPPEFLRPVSSSDGAQTCAEIALRGAVAIDEGFDLRIESFDRVSLGPVEIANTGVVISADNVRLDLSREQTLPEVLAAGFDEGFVGIYIGEAKVVFPAGFPTLLPKDLIMRRCAIGSGGVSGRVEAKYQPTFDPATRIFQGDGAGELFGVPFGLEELALEFRQNAFLESRACGQLLLPFFDRRVALELGLSLDGGLMARITGAAEPGDQYDEAAGLLSLTLEGVLRLHVESISLRVAEGRLTTRVSGRLKPLFGDFDWPTFDVKQLSIDSQGNISLDGGWLDLPEHYSVDLYGFQLELTKLGFGRTEDGGRWLGFSGTVLLSTGLSIGGAVQGLRITWRDGQAPELSIEGVAVEFRYPGVLSFLGSVSYVNSPQEGPCFRGAVTLCLEPLDLDVAAEVVFGRANAPSASGASSYSYVAIYLRGELPTGIILGSTGLSIYGFAGLFALNMLPDRKPPEPWYGLAPGTGWYRKKPIGVARLEKWRPQQGGLALGAGITIGTAIDNGYLFSGRMLLVILVPGPVLLLEGTANILRPRARLEDDNTMFHSLAVLDVPNETAQFAVDAAYDLNPLIKISGAAEALFSPDDVHLYLGQKDPPERRIRADILKIFRADTYLMIDPSGIQTGAWTGFERHWSFGPLSVGVEAWIETTAAISWRPLHFSGGIWLHGGAELSVWGFGIGMSAEASLYGEVFDPFHIRGELSVEICLPWPLPDFGVDITLEWGPDPKCPTLPLPVQEIAMVQRPLGNAKLEPALTIAQQSQGTYGYAWLLPRARLGRSQQTGCPMESDGVAIVSADAGPPDGLPVVPPDALPSVTFNRPVNDDVWAQPATGRWERIGDPKKQEGPLQVRYGMKRVALETWDGQHWQPFLAAKYASPGSEPSPLTGSWQIQGKDVHATNKLVLFAKTPFTFLQRIGRGWLEWLTEQFPDFPCSVPPNRPVSCDFSSSPLGSVLSSPYVAPGCPSLRFEGSVPFVVTQPVSFVGNLDRGLSLPPGGIKIAIPHGPLPLPDAAFWFKLTISGTALGQRVTMIDLLNQSGSSSNPQVHQQTAFLAMDAQERPLPNLNLTPGKGLCCPGTGVLQLTFPSSSGERTPEFLVDAVSLLFMRQSSVPLHIELFDERGTRHGVIDSTTERGPWSVLLPAPVRRVRITGGGGEALLARVAFSCPMWLQAYGVGIDGQTFGPFLRSGDVITVQGSGTAADLIAVLLDGGDHPCLLQVEALLGPDPIELQRSQEANLRLLEQAQRFTATDTVLCPDTTYRLSVEWTVESKDFPYSGAGNGSQGQVEYAYFRTGAPPGAGIYSTPSGVEKERAEAVQAALATLAPYVGSTTPEAIPGRRPRPVYRATDVAVSFNVNYIDQMYRMARRDLSLYLYDRNGRMVRDVTDRLMLSPGAWSASDLPINNEEEGVWTDLINKSPCVKGQIKDVRRQRLLRSSGADRVLEPGCWYEARLVPLLLHDDFSSGMDGWVTKDEGDQAGPSQWRVAEGMAAQRSGIWGGSLSGADPRKPGTILLRQGASFRDVRLGAYVRSAGEGAIGLVFRYVEGDYCRLSLDRQRGYRRLVRVVAGVHTILAEDDALLQKDCDTLLSVEAQGQRLRVYQDGQLIFDVVERTPSRAGTLGLYCWKNPGARFKDVRVDDLSACAPTPYRFSFCTSRFRDLFHHLHSYPDGQYSTPLPADLTDAELVSMLVPAVPLNTVSAPPSEQEAKAFLALQARLAGGERGPQPPAMDITVFERGATPVLVQVSSPEPLDWSASPRLMHAGFIAPWATRPTAVKLADASFTSSSTGVESVTLLAVEDIDPSGLRIEYLSCPGPLEVPEQAQECLFYEQFSGPIDLTEVNRHAVMRRWTFHSEFQPSHWRIGGGALERLAEAPVGAPVGASYAFSGNPSWSDYEMQATLRIDGEGAIGLLIRCQDSQGHYALWIERARCRFVRVHGDTVSELWSTAGGYSEGEPFPMKLEAKGARLRGWLGNGLLFTLTDPVHERGGIGLCCAGGARVRFQDVEVCAIAPEPASPPPLLHATADGTGAGGLLILDEGQTGAPSKWELVDHELRQRSAIRDRSPDDSPVKLGTLAVAPAALSHLRDWVLRVGLRSPGGCLGIVFGYIDQKNYNLLLFDIDQDRCLLVRRLHGDFSVLWARDRAIEQDRPVQVMLVQRGRRLQGLVDEIPLFELDDLGRLGDGLGFYCHNSEGAKFFDISLSSAERCFDRWLLDESFAASPPPGWRYLDDEGCGPSRWEVADGALHQLAAVPGKGDRGTYAVVGEPSWRDVRASVRLLTEAGGRTGGARPIGVVCRFVDQDNHYLLVLDPAGGRRFLRRYGGQVTVLWEGSARAWKSRAGKEYLLTIDCVGSLLRAYEDGDLLFCAEDDKLPSGSFGLYASDNPSACFRTVRIGVTEWRLLHDFGCEARLPEGSQLRIDARPTSARRQTASDAPEAPTRIVKPAPLQGAMAVLRLSGPRRELLHRRLFVPPEGFTAVSANVIRKSDGSDLFLLPPGTPGTGFQPGLYELRWPTDPPIRLNWIVK